MWTTTSQNLTQVFTPFGNGYVQEHRGEETRGYLASLEPREIIDFGTMLATLRAALSLR